MAYRVVYGSLGEEKRSQRQKDHKAAMVAGLLVTCVVVIAVAIHVVALPWVRDVLLPGDSAVTAAALENMVTAILDGRTMSEAVTVFCQEVLANASP